MTILTQTNAHLVRSELLFIQTRAQNRFHTHANHVQLTMALLIETGYLRLYGLCMSFTSNIKHNFVSFCQKTLSLVNTEFNHPCCCDDCFHNHNNDHRHSDHLFLCTKAIRYVLPTYSTHKLNVACMLMRVEVQIDSLLYQFCLDQNEKSTTA